MVEPMDVWELYISAHKGKHPRNAFDLVNFSRSTENTLSFKDAKQLYHENNINTAPAKDKIPLRPRLSIDTDTSSSSDTSSSADAAILRSPKTNTITTNTNTMTNTHSLHRKRSHKRKPRMRHSSQQINSNSHRTHRHKHRNKHKHKSETNTQNPKPKPRSRHNSHTNTIHNTNLSFSSKSSKHKFGVDATKFNMDTILKESEDNTIDTDLRNIYNSDSLDNKLTDNEYTIDDEYTNTERRKRNTSLPVRIIKKSQSIDVSDVPTKRKKHKNVKYKKKTGNSGDIYSIRKNETNHYKKRVKNIRRTEYESETDSKESDTDSDSEDSDTNSSDSDSGESDSDSSEKRLAIEKFSRSNEKFEKYKHKRYRNKHKRKHKSEKTVSKPTYQIKVQSNKEDSNSNDRHKKSKKLHKRFRDTLSQTKTKVKTRASSADPRSIMNGTKYRNQKKRKKKVKPPPSRAMRKSNSNMEANLQKHSKNTRESNIYPIVRDKKEKQRANSDYLRDSIEGNHSQTHSHERSNIYRLDRVKGHKKQKCRHNSESIDQEIEGYKNKHSKFRIGDVVQVSLKIGHSKKVDLARIRYYGQTCLDSNGTLWFGVECFKFQLNTHKICGCLVNDGVINGRKKSFSVKKQGYGTFLKSKGIKSHKCLWSLKISKRALKSTRFEPEMLINASKYGSVKVVKHLFKLLIDQNIKNNIKSKRRKSKQIKTKTRAGSNGFYKNNFSFDDSEYISTIQTGFGYAVLHNHTPIIKIILTHCGSNSMYTNLKRISIKHSHSDISGMVHKTHTKMESNHSGESNHSHHSRHHSDDSNSMSSDISDDEFDDEYDDDFNEENQLQLLQNGISKFYTSDLFDLVCEQRNFKMLQLLIQYDSWPLLSPKSKGLYGLCCKKGYLKWIKYLLQISPYILNMPLLTNDINSTMMHVTILNDRYEYAKYILHTYRKNIQIDFGEFVGNDCMVIPILLLTIMNINVKNILYSIEIIQILLEMGANINWIPNNTLKQQKHLFMNEMSLFESIEDEYYDHKFLFYELEHPNNRDKCRMVIGSILSALIYKFVACFKQTIYEIRNENIKYNKKYSLQHLSDILSLFMLYGIDFEHMEIQHKWGRYDYLSLRWNINNFPYGVCHSKQEFIFIQKIFKKALQKYPIRLLSFIGDQILQSNDYFYQSLFDYNEIDELINIFKLYIIPYSVYDALMFESLHYYAPFTPEVSSPESTDFMFAYQRCPVVE